MKKIFLFLIFFCFALYSADNFSNFSTEADDDEASSNPIIQNPPKFWRIKDKNDPTVNYTATETSIRLILQILNSLKKEVKNEIISTIYIQNSKDKAIPIDTYKLTLQPEAIKKIMIISKSDGSPKSEWIKNLILHAILFEKDNKILTMEALVKKQIISPVNEDDKINFWKIGNKTFATETIKYVILTLQNFCLENYSVIFTLKTILDKNGDQVLDEDCIDILVKKKFVNRYGTLKDWAKTITSIVLYKHSYGGIQPHSFEYLIKNKIIKPCILPQGIELDSDLISSEFVSKEEEKDEDKEDKKAYFTNIIIEQLNNFIMQDNGTTETDKAKTNRNNCN